MEKMRERNKEKEIKRRGMNRRKQREKKVFNYLNTIFVSRHI